MDTADDEPEPAVLRALGAADVAVHEGRAMLRSAPRHDLSGFEGIGEEITTREELAELVQEEVAEQLDERTEAAWHAQPPAVQPLQVVLGERHSSTPPSQRRRNGRLGALAALLTALGAAAAGIGQCASEVHQARPHGAARESPAAVAHH